MYTDRQRVGRAAHRPVDLTQSEQVQAKPGRPTVKLAGPSTVSPVMMLMGGGKTRCRGADGAHWMLWVPCRGRDCW